MDNCFLFDWLTVSFEGLSFGDCISLLGMSHKTWEDQKTGSRLRYAHRLAYDGISIHYTEDGDIKHQAGCCIEMSGQGCRDFETFGSGDWSGLFEEIQYLGGNITRLDIAYDDFRGLLPIDIIADCARLGQFTSRSKRLQIYYDWPEHGQPDRCALTVYHGSRESNFAVRFYDKRAERNAWEEVEHWVRCEIQLRKGCAGGFVQQLQAVGNLGEVFCGVLNNYLEYQCKTSDSNKSRAIAAPWWQKFLLTAQVLRIHSRKDIEYNKQRMLAHIDRNHNPIKTAICTEGLEGFLRSVYGHSEPLPDKYQHIVQAETNADQILEFLRQKPQQQVSSVILSCFDSL